MAKTTRRTLSSKFWVGYGGFKYFKTKRAPEQLGYIEIVFAPLIGYLLYERLRIVVVKVEGAPS